MVGKRRWSALAGGIGLASWAVVACLSAGDQPPIDTSSNQRPTTSVGSEDADLSEEGGTSTACFLADAGGACTDLALCGQPITDNDVSALPPTAVGGAITPGVYALTLFNVFTGGEEAGTLTQTTQSQVFQVSATSTQTTDAGGSDDASSDGAASSSLGYTFQLRANVEGTDIQSSGILTADLATSQVTFAPECPSGASYTRSYSATATTFTLYYTASVGVVENVFTLQ